MGSVKQFLTINKEVLILWGILLVIFIIAAVFVYVNYIQPQLVDMEYRANYEFDKTIENELKPQGLKGLKNQQLFIYSGLVGVQIQIKKI